MRRTNAAPKQFEADDGVFQTLELRRRVLVVVRNRHCPHDGERKTDELGRGSVARRQVRAVMCTCKGDFNQVDEAHAVHPVLQERKHESRSATRRDNAQNTTSESKLFCSTQPRRPLSCLLPPCHVRPGGYSPTARGPAAACRLSTMLSIYGLTRTHGAHTHTYAFICICIRVLTRSLTHSLTARSCRNRSSSCALSMPDASEGATFARMPPRPAV